MLDGMLEGIRAAIFSDDYELAQELANDACRYAESKGIKSDLLHDLTIVAYAPVVREYLVPGLDLVNAGIGMHMYMDLERAARDLGLREEKIMQLLDETPQ